MLKENKVDFKIYLFGLLIGLVICFVSLRYFIFSKGFVFWQDLYWVYSSKLYVKYLWNEYVQKPGIPNHLVGKYWLYFFPPEIAERLIFIAIFSISGLSMFYTAYKLTSNYFASLLAVMFFIMNPIFIMRLGHWLLLWYYSFLPILFYCTLSAFNNIYKLSTLKILKASIYISLVLFLMSPSVRMPYYFLIIPLTFFICLSRPYKHYLKKSLYLTILVIIIYLFLSSVWLLPLIFKRSFAPNNYIVTSEVLSLLSRNSEISKVFSLQSFWATRWFNEVFMLSNLSGFKFLWTLALFSIPILAFLSLLLYKDKIISCLILFSLIIIFLAKGVQQPFGEFYKWLVFNIPLLSKFGWQFRGPNKWNLLLIFTYSILIGLTINEIFKKLGNKDKKLYKIFKFILILILFVIPLIAGYPLLTGDLNGKLRPQPVPNDYKQLDKWLRERGTDFKVAVYPRPPPWGIIKPIIRYDLYWRFSVDSLLNNKTNKFGALLNPWSVKYIIVRTEPSKSETELKYFLMMFKQSKDFINSIKYQDDIKFVKKFGTLYVFENLDYSAPICVSGSNLAILDDLSILNSLTKINLLDKELVSICFLSQNVKMSYLIPYDKIILNKNVIYQYIIHNYNSRIIKPFDATIHHNPSKLWSKAMTSDPLHGEWHPYLKRFRMENWQLDYGYGLVFTWAKNTNLTIPFNVKKTDNYKLFIRYFKNQKGGEIIVYLDGKPITIETKDQLNEFVWKDLGTFHLKAGEHKIVLENVNGFNAVNLFVLIPEKDYIKAKEEVEKLLQNKTIIYIFEAESDLYRSNAKVIKDPNASNGEMLLFYENGKAWQDVEVVKNGTYRLALRGYGDFKVTIANHTFHIHSNGNFSYTPLFLLKRGEYNLTITPAKFANLLYNPSFELVSKGKPVGWKLGSKKFEIMLDKWYRGKYSLKVVTSATKGWSWIYSRAIDVKPGEKYLIVTHMKVYNAKASHIPVEGYFIGKGWKEIIQIPSGKAGTGTHGWREYSTILKIPKNVTKIRVVLNAGWVLNKNKGKAITWFDDIKVVPLDRAPKLDVVWLYSTKENKTIQELFEIKEKPARVISFKKVNPTLWKVRVQAKKPFMLSFAEAYDPLWEARVYKDGKLVEKVKSIPLYSVINGFWINKTGNLTIIIRYLPQDWFELGLKISGLTFIGCIGYLFYDWRREKGDRWAKRLEDKVKSMLNRIRKPI